MLNTSCTREIIISQRESSWLVELLLLFFPVICLVEMFVWWERFLKYTQDLWGDAQVGAGSAETERSRRCFMAAASTTSPWGTQPCAQAIIVNDKVTIEVIIVLN